MSNKLKKTILGEQHTETLIQEEQLVLTEGIRTYFRNRKQSKEIGKLAALEAIKKPKPKQAGEIAQLRNSIERRNVDIKNTELVKSAKADKKARLEDLKVDKKNQKINVKPLNQHQIEMKKLDPNVLKAQAEKTKEENNSENVNLIKAKAVLKSASNTKTDIKDHKDNKVIAKQSTKSDIKDYKDTADRNKLPKVNQKTIS